EFSFLNPSSYYQMLTQHGMIMIVYLLTALLLGGFGNYLIPLMIGARDMAFPVLNMLSYWTFAAASVVMGASFFVEGGPASSGWTMYPPLSAVPGAVPSRAGQILWVASVILVGTSSILGGINFVATILRLRAPGMTLLRMPLTCWAYLATSAIILLGTPVLASALVMLLLDQTGLTTFFGVGGTAIGDVPVRTAGGGQPLLFQHLFWFYSHPVVYLMILPGLALVADAVSIYARKPAFGYRVSIGAMLAIVVLGFIVWGHHLYVSGMNPYLGIAFSVLTALVGVPSGVLVFNMLATLWKGSIRLTAGMLSAAATILIFVTGGLSGLFNAMSAIDMYVHDTYWVVAHFHYVVGGASVFAIFTGLYTWLPKMTGRTLLEGLGRVHVILTFIFFNAVFFTMHLMGVGGMHRRIAEPQVYDWLRPYQPVQVFVTVCALLLGASQLLFVANLVWSLWRGRPAGPNPWGAATLEWTTSSPPPEENFVRPPRVYRWPYEYGRANGTPQDWVPQHEPEEVRT
ncbi:MAG: cbb3-type cytochrome c oxidase subunit I, partial [Planctomycetota bacterium]